MKYLCLVYFEERTLEAQSSAEFESLRREALAHMDELEKRGNLVVANALQHTRTATSLRLRNGKISITDGPFAETKEQLGGFMLLEARDLSEAVQLAGTSPMARLGSVEVRPTWELEQKEPRAGRGLPAKAGARVTQ